MNACPASISLFLIEESGLKHSISINIYFTSNFSLLNWREWIETRRLLIFSCIIIISLFLIEESGLKQIERGYNPGNQRISLFLIEESGLKHLYLLCFAKTWDYFSLLNWREWIETKSFFWLNVFKVISLFLIEESGLKLVSFLLFQLLLFRFLSS